MARKASVRYWPTRGGFCCWHQGRQVLLAKGPDDSPDGPIYNAALKAFSRLVFGDAQGPTLGDVVEKYLEWAKRHREPSTAAIRENMLKPVKASLGVKPVADLTPFAVQEWCDREQTSRSWCDGTARLTLVSLRACLNWARKMRLIAFHPLAEMELPEEGSRGLECVLSPEQEAAVLKACKGATHEFVQALRDTGARPSEISGAEAKHYDPALRALVYEARVRKGEKRHKTRRTGKARVIYLRGETLANVQRLVKLHPTGPLFRTARRKCTGPHKGKVWGWFPGGILHAFRRLRKKTGLSALIPYSFRHTFAVRWLRAGKPIEALAEVLGTSINMIQKHYGHLADQRDYLRRLVDELDGPQAGG